VALSLTNDLPFPRIGELVAGGVPLVRGFAGGAYGLALLGPDGQPVPAQITASSAYRDGTPRWVLVRFAADVPARGRAVYRLAKGDAASLTRPLACRLLEDRVEIDTGVAQFTVGTVRFRLFDSVTVDGQPLLGAGGGAVLEKADGAPLVGETVTSAALEESGPLVAVLCLRGEIGPGEPLPVARYVCRLAFQAGSSEVRVFYTLHNPAAHAHPGNSWDLGSGGSVLMEDFSLLLPLGPGPWASRVGAGAQQPALAAVSLYQDSSGGPNWNSPNHVDKDMRIPVTFQGYRVTQPDGHVAEGTRADGWLHARSPAGGVAVGVRDFWQNCPKALEATGDGLRVGLWPREYAGVHELLGGEQKTHELLFLFHGPEVPDEAIERRAAAFHHPLYAMPDPEAVLATRAFWPTGPLDREQFGPLEATCDTFVEPVGTGGESVITKWDQIDEFGWRHFGDTFADNEGAPPEMVRDFPEHHFGSQPISHFGNEYDVSYGVMLQGLRRQDPRWMWLADVLCRHYADICIYHSDAEGAAAYRHGPFTHTTHATAAYRSTHRMYPSEAERYQLQYASGGPNAGHCYVASLAQHYYLTGDRVSREAFLEVADWAVNSPWFTEMMMGDQRGIGNLLMTHVYAYELTGDREYYDAALAMIDYVQEPFSGLGGTLFAKAAGRFLDMKLANGEEDADYRKALSKLLPVGDLYLTLPADKPAEWLELTCFDAEVLFTCYLHAPRDHPNRERYYARGKALMDAVQERWPGAYMPTKSLIMCFGNTGAYMKALEVHAREGG
jgi:hypothetical protein